MKTECRRGHKLEGSNLYVQPDGKRQCRECKKIRTHNNYYLPEYAIELPPIVDHHSEKIKEFWSLVEKKSDSECWIFNGLTTVFGYGLFSIDGETSKAHRISYEEKYGKIEKGNIVHHICGTKLCVNPSHLEEMDKSYHNFVHQNTLCARGLHKLDGENLYDSDGSGHRQCLQCKRVTQWNRRHPLDPRPYDQPYDLSYAFSPNPARTQDQTPEE